MYTLIHYKLQIHKFYPLESVKSNNVHFQIKKLDHTDVEIFKWIIMYTDDHNMCVLQNIIIQILEIGSAYMHDILVMLMEHYPGTSLFMLYLIK